MLNDEYEIRGNPQSVSVPLVLTYEDVGCCLLFVDKDVGLAAVVGGIFVSANKS